MVYLIELMYIPDQDFFTCGQMRVFQLWEENKLLEFWLKSHVTNAKEKIKRLKVALWQLEKFYGAMHSVVISFIFRKFQFTPDEEKALKQPIIERFEYEGHPYFSSAR